MYGMPVAGANNEDAFCVRAVRGNVEQRTLRINHVSYGTSAADGPGVLGRRRPQKDYIQCILCGMSAGVFFALNGTFCLKLSSGQGLFITFISGLTADCRCSGLVVGYRTRKREVAGSMLTRSTPGNFKQVAYLLCVQANSASCPERDVK